LTEAPPTAITALLTSKLWWRNAALTALCFCRHCILPAFILIVAGSVLIGGLWVAASNLISVGTHVVGLQQILIGMGSFCVALMITGTLILLSLGLWVIRMTAYVRSYMMLCVNGNRPLSKTEIAESQRDAIAYVAERKGYIARFWGFMTLFLIGPAITCMFSAGIKAMTSRVVTSGMITLNLPLWFDITISVLAAVLFLFLTENGVVGLVVASLSQKEPLAAAKQAMALSFRLFLPACLLALAGLLFNFFLASPQMLFQLNKPEAILAFDDPRIMLLENFWQGATSVFVWNFTMTPICELLRGKVE
jgi:hypothetical protein